MLWAGANGLERSGTGRNDILADMEGELRLKGYSLKTRKAYLGHVRRFINIYGDREKYGEKEVRSYLLRLLEEQDKSHAYVNQVISALKILFKNVLKRPGVVISVPRRKLPDVLSQQEISML